MTNISPELFRKNFGTLKDTIHFSSCSLGPRSDQLDLALSEMLDAMSDSLEPWSLYEIKVDAIRRKFAKSIGALPEQIALLPNASVAAFQIASCMAFKGRTKILTTDQEFPSIAHVWLAQAARGVSTVFVDEPTENGYAHEMGNDVGLVSAPHATYSESRLLPIKKISSLVHKHGGKLFVDAYQTAGVVPIDVSELNCDYLVAGTSKYLLGLPGLAFLFVREPLGLEVKPQLTGWWGRKNPFEFDPKKLDYANDARLLETGTISVPSVFAAAAGLDILSTLDIKQVQTHIMKLLGQAHKNLTAQGEVIRSPNDRRKCGAHIAIVDHMAKDLSEYLKRFNISTSPRGNLLRISCHYHNTANDIETVCARIADYRAEKFKEYPGDFAINRLLAWEECANASTFPYDAVLNAFRYKGKHFIENNVLQTLAKFRENKLLLAGKVSDVEQVHRFIDSALDKFDNRYNYVTYCCLNQLKLPTNSDVSIKFEDLQQERDHQIMGLVSDCLLHELDVAEGLFAYESKLKITGRALTKRLLMGLNSIKCVLARNGIIADLNATDIFIETRRICMQVQEILTDQEQLTLKLSIQPGTLQHDEYLFLRVLQSFETNFAFMVEHMNTLQNMKKPDVPKINEVFSTACAIFKESRGLFPLLASMRREAFHEFREYTEGASAIQSRNYKRIESFCRFPDDDRLNSLAYTAVPEVRRQIIDSPHTFEDVFAMAQSRNRASQSSLDQLKFLIDQFEQHMIWWRHVHYKLAVKMLGEKPGTGSTEGTPYLKKIQNLKVFNEFDDEGGVPHV